MSRHRGPYERPGSWDSFGVGRGHTLKLRRCQILRFARGCYSAPRPLAGRDLPDQARDADRAVGGCWRLIKEANMLKSAIVAICTLISSAAVAAEAKVTVLYGQPKDTAEFDKYYSELLIGDSTTKVYSIGKVILSLKRDRKI